MAFGYIIYFLFKPHPVDSVFRQSGDRGNLSIAQQESQPQRRHTEYGPEEPGGDIILFKTKA
jgi:hypothetical protein